MYGSMGYSLVTMLVIGLVVSTSSLTTGTIESRLEMLERQSLKYQDELAETKSELLATRTELTKTRSNLAVTRSDLAVTRSDLAETRSDLAETQSDLAETRSDLAETRQYLSHTLHALAGKSGVPSKLNRTESSAHNIRRRDAPDQREDNSQDDVLSSLSLHDLMPLLSSRCRDGRDGKDGKDGFNGINGKDGKDGINGKDGTNGINGKDGKDGINGKDGNIGRDGRDGIPGVQGVPGAPGLRGSPGSSVNSTLARDGLPGPKGARGLPGVAGTHGATGASGVAGPPGSPGTSPESGSVYTRWGRTSCHGDATLLYQGFAAGGYHGHTGNGVNYQCLHLEPEYNNVNSGSDFSVISGSEYQSYSLGLFPNAAYDQNVPCARCYTSRSAVVMIPSRRTCNYGWTKEYEGYLMTERGRHPHPTTYECVDLNPEYISGHQASTNGALFYFVVPDCSGEGTTGHCPPYDANKQLTCVVCSK